MNSKKVFFELIKECKQARLGKISTSKGDIDTPAFYARWHSRNC